MYTFPNQTLASNRLEFIVEIHSLHTFFLEHNCTGSLIFEIFIQIDTEWNTDQMNHVAILLHLLLPLFTMARIVVYP